MTTDTMKPPAPWRHQTEAHNFIKNKPAAMLAMEMGTGKSRCAIDYMHYHNARKVLILAPLSVVDHVWPNQFALHSQTPVRVTPLGARYPNVKAKLKEAKLALHPNKAGQPAVIVLNLESAVREPLATWLTGQPWDLLIIDESHRIKLPSGNTSRWVSRLSDRIPRKLALTGTPMPHSPLDIYAQYRALDKSIFGTSYQEFKAAYAIITEIEVPVRPSSQAKEGTAEPQTKTRPKIIDFKDLDDLHERFYSIAYRVTTLSALDLPPTQHTYHPVLLGANARRIYTEMALTFVADLQEDRVVTSKNALSRLLRLQQITSGFAPTPDGTTVQVDKAKQQALQDIMKDLPQDEPLVVFARFRQDLNTIRKTALEQGRPAFEISGPRKQLPEWLTCGGVLAVQIQAGGLGLDLTKARHCVYYSLGFSLGDYQQTMARLHRPGQERPVQYIHLIAAGTVDEAVIKALNNKTQVIEAILETGSIPISAR